MAWWKFFWLFVAGWLGAARIVRALLLFEQLIETLLLFGG